MAIDEPRLRIRRSIEEKLGVEEAAYLIEGRPPGGWESLVTKEHLDLRLETLEHRILAVIDRRLRAQTWITTTTIVAGLGLAFGFGQAL
jgi:hypothetical protein